MRGLKIFAAIIVIVVLTAVAIVPHTEWYKKREDRINREYKQALEYEEGQGKN